MLPRIPAVVVGGNLNALGVARSLARSRIPTYIITENYSCPAAWSRHATTVRTTNLYGEALINTLLELASSLKCRPVLLLTQDASVTTVSAARQRLQDAYHIELPDEVVVEQLSDKIGFDTLAAQACLPVPRSCSVRNVDDLKKLCALTPPFVVKPAHKGRIPAVGSESAVRAESIEQACELASQILIRTPGVIVQEWIDGTDSEIFFTFFCVRKDGSPAAFFSGRKLRSEPPGVGSTAICIPAPDFAETLERETVKLLERVSYRGLGSLEFKRDARTNQFLMIEPTVGRTDWQEEIATLCGVNLPAIAYWLALGHEPQLQCHHTATRLRAWRAGHEFQIPEIFRTDTQVFDAYFRWSDPLPGVYFYAYEHGVRRILRRAWRELITYFNGHRG